MKKFLSTFFLLIIVLTCLAQSAESTIYKVYLTEFYIYNPRTEKWQIESKNENVDIDMVSYKNVINIQAKTPSLFRIDKSSEEKIGGGRENYFGVRYDALECVNMNKCKIDLVRLSDLNSKSFIFSVIFTDEVLGKVNLRYYSVLE